MFSGRQLVLCVARGPGAHITYCGSFQTSCRAAAAAAAPHHSSGAASRRSSTASASGGGSMGKTSVIWFRKGLRLHDNPALLEAAKGADHLCPIFILDPWFLQPDK